MTMAMYCFISLSGHLTCICITPSSKFPSDPCSMCQ